jgi:Leucine-rich repeat (LRR) protein
VLQAVASLRLLARASVSDNVGMDSEPRKASTASNAATPFVRRLYPATWAVIFFAIAILALIEIPGRRSGATTYVHGWPVVYLRRDYVNDPDFIAALSSTGWTPGSTIMPASNGGTTKTAMDLWVEDGWPWEVERTLNPWSIANTTEMSLAGAGLDCLAVLLIVLTVAEIFQRWRRRRAGSVFRFRLRTMLIAVVLLSFACAWAVGKRREWQDEQDAIPKLPSAALRSSGNWPSYPYRWVPPSFLPECFLKVGDIGQYFNHITQLDLDDDPASGQCNYASTEELLEPLARLPRLAKLTLSRAAVSDGELKQLSAMSSLSELSIRCDKVTTAGIDQLRKLPRLRLLAEQGLGDEAVERLNSFTSLGVLSLDSRDCTRIDLVRLPHLRELAIGSSGDVGWQQPDLLKLADLDSLPALESLTVGSAVPVRLKNLPSLRHVELWGAKLDATGMQQVRALPTLESLVLYNGASSIGVPFELRGMTKLKSLFAWGAAIENLHLRDLPNFESLELLNNSALREVDFGQLPKLRSIRILGSSLLPTLDLRGLNLTSLTITDMEQSIDGGTYVPDRPHARRLHGFVQLLELGILSLPWTELDSDILNGIARMSRLTSLDLTGTWLVDADLSRLKQLKNLTELNLSNCDISDAGLDEIQGFPSLATLSLFSTPVSDAAVQRLRKRRPNLQINFYDGCQQAAADDLQIQIDGTVAGERTAIDVANPEVMGDRDVEKLAGTAGLLTLSLRSMHLTDAGTASLALLRDLQSLDLANTHISDAGLVDLGRLIQLGSLSLSKTRVHGDGLRHLQALNHLQSLDLSASEVTDAGLASLQCVPHLERLSLSQTAITDAGLARLESVPELRVLDLSQTKVTDAGLQHLRSLSNLEALDLSHCDIEGPGLDQLRSLPRLQSLNLSANPRLTNAAIERLTKFAFLKTLVLDRSDLSAQSLRTLAGMKSLRDLWWFGGDLNEAQIDALKQIHFTAKLHLGGAYGRSPLRSALPDADFTGFYGYGGKEFEVFTPVVMRKVEPPPPNPPVSGGAF